MARIAMGGAGSMRRRLGLGVAMLLVAPGGGASSQTTQLNLLMRSKLVHSQRILEAVVTSNWTLLDEQSRELERITQNPAWTVLQFPEYARHSAAFVRAAADLQDAARQRDLEGASLGFVALATSCVSCHRYLARARIVAGQR